MDKEKMYQDLKREFTDKMGRELKREEKEFIMWMVEEHHKEEEKKNDSYF
ncbi:hypothetical protein GCM10010954_31650 [Halobacillus andaensis]|uniref:Uncharacterized protein n=1 Tax=Halobacillus andaensis TaxID=1176239 RepID=A0A917BA15_HALAA|nr:hypothetical protein [Halobacillus andaensis]MBP2005271.1 hypothetical protein [Halobacillus andaensis]GGF30186.1 hypothetical protein GCM10010954_31650 [Halobacillus andaensis]